MDVFCVVYSNILNALPGVWHVAGPGNSGAIIPASGWEEESGLISHLLVGEAQDVGSICFCSVGFPG